MTYGPRRRGRSWPRTIAIDGHHPASGLASVAASGAEKGARANAAEDAPGAGVRPSRLVHVQIGSRSGVLAVQGVVGSGGDRLRDAGDTDGCRSLLLGHFRCAVVTGVS